MDVSILDLKKLFNMQVRYEIPTYQRRYVWDQENQWEPLWEDIRNTAEHRLENSEYKTAHFLGAVVIQQKLNSTGSIQTPEVVDGQQRLTTMQLLLDAVQEVFDTRNHKNAAVRLSDMVLNGEAYRDDNPDRAFKVWPTKEDQDAFRQTMSNDLPSDEYKESLIVQAHEFFKLQVNHWLDANSKHPGQPEQTCVKVLEEVLSGLLQLVVIDLAYDEEPHVIYETLNARGTPLLQSDLIKNMILYEASKSTSEDTSNLWDFDDDWWKDEILQGRLRRPRSDAFLNYWLVMRRQEEVAHNNVFSTFRDYFERVGNSDAEVVATDIRNVGNAYAKIVNSEIPVMKTFLYRMEVMQVGVLTPVLLWLVSSDIPTEQLQKGISALESYLIRRMVCRMTTKDYNRLILGLLGKLNNAAQAGDVIVEYLKAQDADTREWPGDTTLMNAFVSLRLYKLLTKGRLRIVLEGLEAGLRTNKAESMDAPPDLTMEHIMPDAWHKNWKLPSDTENLTQAEIDRDHIIHTIGNLTLVNQRLNTTLSNAEWAEKRQALDDHSTLFLNKELIKETVWNEGKIEERSRQLAQVAAKIWPHADRI